MLFPWQQPLCSSKTAPPRATFSGPSPTSHVSCRSLQEAWGRHGGSPWDGMKVRVYVPEICIPCYLQSQLCTVREPVSSVTSHWCLWPPSPGLRIMSVDLDHSVDFLGRVWYIIESWTHVIHTCRISHLLCLQHAFCSFLSGLQNAKEQLCRKMGRAVLSVKPWELHGNLTIIVQRIIPKYIIYYVLSYFDSVRCLRLH